MSKIIYQPKGAASEYAKWAANFYNGCSGRCTYCYNRTGITAKVLGGDKPTLKRCLNSPLDALIIFEKELEANLAELQKHGIFFNFVSDPCLRETWDLNSSAIYSCLKYDVPAILLTKQVWWVPEFIHEVTSAGTWMNKKVWEVKRLVALGFTLTGHDELEPGCAANEDRIWAMRLLHDEGFKTWASIEPIIDIDASGDMIGAASECCDLMKIGLQSGKHYDKEELCGLMRHVISLADASQFKIYFKDSILKASGMTRYPLGNNEVDRDYNMFTEEGSK